MTKAVFVSDIHGDKRKFRAFFDYISSSEPDMVFIGGDIFPSGLISDNADSFMKNIILPGLKFLKKKNPGPSRIFAILGNDDSIFSEELMLSAEKMGYLNYVNMKKTAIGKWDIAGYSYVPPTPFLIKDWEKYDVSRYADPGCINPEEGRRFKPVEENEIRYSSIKKDLEILFPGTESLKNSIILFHTPPYRTKLDRAALDGKFYDHAPLDVHVGSIAVRDLIIERKPLVTLHGHIHESARLSGSWKDILEETVILSAAHDGKELAVIEFEPDMPEKAVRLLL
jgi:uncharacterized protein